MNLNQNHPRCYSYVRFSTPNQIEGNSLDRQLELAREYASEKGLVLDESLTMTDLGFSAFSGEHRIRGVLGEFLNLVRSGDIPDNSVLLVESLDRLSREQVLPALNQFIEIINNGITIVTLTDRMEYNKKSIDANFTQIIISIMIMSRAHEESLQKSKRISAAWNKKRENITNTKITGKCPAWLTLSNDKSYFEVIQDKADLINKIFEMSDSGIGTKSIAKKLNEQNIPSWKTRKRKTDGWQASYICKILNNRAVLGEFQPHKMNPNTSKREPVGYPIPEYFPPIVPESLFYSVQIRMKAGTHKGGKTGKISNLFGGIAKCGYCGASMQFVNKGKPPKGGKYLVCDNARRGIKCIYKYLRYEEIEDAFLKFLREVNLTEILSNESSTEPSNRTKLLSQQSIEKGKLLELDNKIMLFENQIPDIRDDVEMKYFRKKIGELLRERAEKESLLSELDFKIREIDSTINNINNNVENIFEFIKTENSSIDENDRTNNRLKLRTELRRLLNNVVFYPIGIVYSDEIISKENEWFDKIINDPTCNMSDYFREIRDSVISNMQLTKLNSKDKRFFTINFKNGNYRNIVYSSTNSCYYISKEKIGNILNFVSNGNSMKSITMMNDDDLINAEIDYYIKRDPNINYSSDDIAKMKSWLYELNNTQLYNQYDENLDPSGY